MRKSFRIVVCAVGGIAIMVLLVAVVMWLWNLIIPAITGWTEINYWQALGLALLFRLLTGHFGSRISPRRGHRHFHEMMRGMSREERRAFIREKLNKLSNGEAGNE